ncbi:MAG TPA: glucose-6-phosphate dehydrogenase [Solirubrobacterales bacterium]
MSVETAEAPAVAPAATVPDDHVIVLFGATGDLARRKLLPGMFHLADAGLMPKRFVIIGVSRSEMIDEEFEALTREAAENCGHGPISDASWERFSPSLRAAHLGDGYDALSSTVREAEDELGGEPRILHYLSLPPSAHAEVIESLGAAGLAPRSRIILEKPFGTDLSSARSLDEVLHRVFDEEQIFRIDHYLGRDAVQNLLAMRFANGMYEPVWNRNLINHVQIDVPETLGIGMRAGFYEQTGAFRDMVVTHLFQVLGFVAMEPPNDLTSKSLMAERQKVFDAMLPIDPANVIRGQYEGYREEDGVAPDSETETYVALIAFVDNWRWAGVPFFLRTGKRMAQSRHVLTISFKMPPRRMFPIDTRHFADTFGCDHLTFELGDPGSISASFLAKLPGPTLRLGQAHMNFSYGDGFGGTEQSLDAYERLIHDVMVGHRTFFTTSEGIERLWEVAEPLLQNPPPPQHYEQGSWGPRAADSLIAPHHWHLPSGHI